MNERARRTRIFFAVFGAFLLLATAFHARFLLFNGAPASAPASRQLEWFLTAATLLSGVLLTGAAMRMPRGQALWLGVAGSVLFLGQELAAVMVAWRWQPPRATLEAYRGGLIASRLALSAVGLIALWQSARLRRSPPVQS